MKSLRVITVTVLVIASAAARCDADSAPATRPWSIRMADSIIARHPRAIDLEANAAPRNAKWSYSTAFAVYAIAQVGMSTGDDKYLDYARRYMKEFISDDGAISTPTYNPAAFKLDDVAPGRLLLLLHEREPADPRWIKAADLLAEQLRRQPRTADGGFWHKQIYPHQMWLDGIFMGCPFMAEYGTVTRDTRWLDEAIQQIITIGKHTHDPPTGLYYHGYDESRSERWANPRTGASACFWGRAVGWYAMGIVETLERTPADHPRRRELLALLRGLADAIVRVQDSKTGVWYQVLDQPNRPGNYLESSASCMFVYALAKGVRLQLLDEPYDASARRGYAGIVQQFVEVDPRTERVSLKETCRVAGLGGDPYRDGSFDYYIRERRVANDPKGLGSFMLASLEIERAAAASDAKR